MSTDKKTQNIDEKIPGLWTDAEIVRRNIKLHGGSFMRALGNAMDCAALENLRKIRATWNKEWKLYLELDGQYKNKISTDNLLQELLERLTSASYDVGYYTAKRDRCPKEFFDDYAELVEGYTAEQDRLQARILGYCDGAKTLNAEEDVI